MCPAQGYTTFVAGEPENCFPRNWKNGACPPLPNVRILLEKAYDVTTQTDYDKCWEHCRDLHNKGIISLTRL